ncbi:MAG TPA: efflux transporter outer membrane subunit [Opitutaceae bacterium]|nr:efflux transporter outer membrane subunit [Lacunisphaera sp.]HEX2854291.1 efflux transporter outer membrane subunit [Opitutaceae bacterium]
MTLIRPTIKLLAAGCTLLSGCSLAPKYQRPAAPVAATYSLDASTASTPAADLAWQQFFGDARLRGIIQLALENNRDLRVAALNVERVRAIYGIQRSVLIPSLDATGDAVRQRTPATLSPTGQPVTGSVYEVGLQIPSYEIDFFGRVMSLRNQVLHQYLATEEARRSAQIALISAVARQYLAALAADEQLAVARQTLRAAEQSYDLNRQSFEGGVTSELDLRTAEGQREAVRASVAALEQRAAQLANGLVLLVGSPLPTDLPPVGSLATQALVEDLPPGLPADLLARRPDVRAAEEVLRAANANIGVARAAFFPSIKLTAFGGSASTELSGLFESGSGRWSFAPSITLPIFAGGRNKAQLDVAWIEQRIEIAQYEQAIQNAFREVADALAVRSIIGRTIAAQQARVNAARRRYELTQQRFDAGVDPYLTVLLAQQEQFAAEQSLIDARLARLANLTALYSALGGGWQNDTPTAQP